MMDSTGRPPPAPPPLRMAILDLPAATIARIQTPLLEEAQTAQEVDLLLDKHLEDLPVIVKREFFHLKRQLARPIPPAALYYVDKCLDNHVQDHIEHLRTHSIKIKETLRLQTKNLEKINMDSSLQHKTTQRTPSSLLLSSLPYNSSAPTTISSLSQQRDGTTISTDSAPCWGYSPASKYLKNILRIDPPHDKIPPPDPDPASRLSNPSLLPPTSAPDTQSPTPLCSHSTPKPPPAPDPRQQPTAKSDVILLLAQMMDDASTQDLSTPQVKPTKRLTPFVFDYELALITISCKHHHVLRRFKQDQVLPSPIAHKTLQHTTSSQMSTLSSDAHVKCASVRWKSSDSNNNSDKIKPLDDLSPPEIRNDRLRTATLQTSNRNDVSTESCTVPPGAVRHVQRHHTRWKKHRSVQKHQPVTTNKHIKTTTKRQTLSETTSAQHPDLLSPSPHALTTKQLQKLIDCAAMRHVQQLHMRWKPGFLTSSRKNTTSMVEHLPSVRPSAHDPKTSPDNFSTSRLTQYFSSQDRPPDTYSVSV